MKEMKIKNDGSKVLESDPQTERRSGQPLLPRRHEAINGQGYEIYPAFHLDNGKIYDGLDSLADHIAARKLVLIDGYVGVFWQKISKELDRLLRMRGITVCMQATDDWMLSPASIDVLTEPYMGEKDSIWGTKCNLGLEDFFDRGKIASYRPDDSADINIVIGCGAALARPDVPVIYLELPKNELQYRMRAGSIANLGYQEAGDATSMYKRFYFIDWVLLNGHKKNILERVEIVADAQWPDAFHWMQAADLRQALQTMSENTFRVRPWFEPGAWGGQWIKKNLPGINRDEVNYAWSFELITPENGLLLESSGLLLEVAFDWLMLLHGRKILGEKNAAAFGDEFPIRFDFLDTVKGGNLSIQCHPGLDYIRKKFGEHITQDETYYILDAEEDAGVYLGFQENIDPVLFREELEKSDEQCQPLEATKYVQLHPAQKHDLFLIPNGTVHSAGAGNLVLEISATPYIFTFKMYDWLRLDLDGQPRPINIEHAFNNLDFSRKGETVKEELISRPVLLASGPGWKQEHLPTHREHFYDVHRYEFENKVQIATDGSCHVLMLVEGSAVVVETQSGFRQRFHYAETFVIPAAAIGYTLTNEGKGTAKVVKAFLK